MPDWLEIAAPLFRKLLSDPKCLDNFAHLMEPVVRNQFETWAKSGLEIPLFQSMSELTSTAMLQLLLGPEFTKRHSKELIPMIRKYDKAIQKPQVRLLPRWASKEGCFLINFDRRFGTLVTEEMKYRLENLDRYRHNGDYFQEIRNVLGDKYSEGPRSKSRIMF